MDTCLKCHGYGLVAHEVASYEQPHPAYGGFEASSTIEEWCDCTAGDAAKFDHETRYAA